MPLHLNVMLNFLPISLLLNWNDFSPNEAEAFWLHIWKEKFELPEMNVSSFKKFTRISVSTVQDVYRLSKDTPTFNFRRHIEILVKLHHLHDQFILNI